MKQLIAAIFLLTQIPALKAQTSVEPNGKKINLGMYSRIKTLDGKYISKDNSCSSTILFKSNGEFFSEGGCEAKSNISKGNYTINRDKIQFSSNEASLKYSIKENNKNKNNQILVTIIDVEGKALSNFKVSILRSEVQSDTSKAIVQLATDEIGQLKIDGSKIMAISLEVGKLRNAGRQENKNYKWEYVANFSGDHLTIQFNYPAFCLLYPEIEISSINKTLTKTKNINELIDEENRVYQKDEK